MPQDGWGHPFQYEFPGTHNPHAYDLWSFGADGNLTLRADDHTLVGYAIGWGTTIPTEPYVTDMTAGDWKQIFELEAEWKKKKNYT